MHTKQNSCIKGLTSQDTSIPNRRSSSHLNIPNDRGTWGHKCILINHRCFIKYVHQSSMPRHYRKFIVNNLLYGRKQAKPVQQICRSHQSCDIKHVKLKYQWRANWYNACAQISAMQWKQQSPYATLKHTRTQDEPINQLFRQSKRVVSPSIRFCSGNLKIKEKV